MLRALGPVDSMSFLLLALVTAMMVGCGESSKSSSQGTRSKGTASAKSDHAGKAETSISNRAESPASANLSILFLGNSHTRPIPALLEKIYGDRQPETKVYFRMASGFGFLDQQAKSQKIRNEITEHKWDFVVLQAQKYSTTGKYDYSIDGAVQLAKLASDNGSQVIMYPEFPRRGEDEYRRIRTKHEQIAEKTEVVIAPIGEAWKKAGDRMGLDLLYNSDGNHASGKGSILVASVFFALTAKSDDGSVPNEDNEFLDIARQAVSEM